MPTVLPMPSGDLPGWHKSTSPVWSGYSSFTRGVLGVRAQWVEPQVSGGPNSNVYIWIGVGGWAQTQNELVQIGALAYTDSSGHTTHRVWYETVPQLSQLTEMFISPGDTIFAVMELEPGSNQRWNLSLKDVTQNTTFTTSINYPSRQMFADFVVEDPRIGSTADSAPLYPFQRFTSVNFTRAQIHYADGWHSIGALPMIQIRMLQKGKVVTYPKDIALPDSFSVIYASS
ncbi:G1 family glutamic endopeptidase [Ktedonobacter sp. SOSP1-52]|uniref:G1 family glutamic endopeptidase n=1 Tax=Ktedonobacter sp. SOSP1-52 TaxID=2778366 RepID=UPI0027DCEBFC|nr:G1 family glutamic endopeptidase [Ktedonobacter sp. SOSP1-52]